MKPILLHDHNGKPVKETIGKNIRISDAAYDTIKKYVLKNGHTLGGFIERAALDKIKSIKSSSKS